ncbi:C40 family peptidase [Sinomicrobium sp. M5D2P17]
MKNIVAVLALCVLFTTSCTENSRSGETEFVEKSILDTKNEFAPDKRVALFDITAKKEADMYVLKGETNLPDALKALKAGLEQNNITYTDSITLLPAPSANSKGIIRISVANLRAKPSHAAEMVTQATLGTPVTILKERNDWYYIQTPDKYLAWVDKGGLEPKNNAAFTAWDNSSKIIYRGVYGTSYTGPETTATPVSDLVAGSILEYLDETPEYYKVQYPDRKTAYLKKADAVPYTDWLQSLHADSTNLVKTAKRLMGLPYLWGGTSTKGVDCSGFTKTIYYLNGMILPRDASQQVHTGVPIDDSGDFEKLLPGDLLFFGVPAKDGKPERIIHVGMWIGNNKFIHSMGDVRISSVDKSSPEFDEYNYNRYLRTKRIIGKEGLNFKDKEKHMLITSK